VIQLPAVYNLNATYVLSPCKATRPLRVRHAARKLDTRQALHERCFDIRILLDETCSTRTVLRYMYSSRHETCSTRTLLRYTYFSRHETCSTRTLLRYTYFSRQETCSTRTLLRYMYFSRHETCSTRTLLRYTHFSRHETGSTRTLLRYTYFSLRCWIVVDLGVPYCVYKSTHTATQRSSADELCFLFINRIQSRVLMKPQLFSSSHC
jgi:hypothetical protein